MRQSGRCLILLVAVYFKALVAVAPVFIYFYKNFKVYFLVKELFKRLAGLCRNLFESYALMTDDDTFLAVAFHIDDCFYVDVLGTFFK